MVRPCCTLLLCCIIAGCFVSTDAQASGEKRLLARQNPVTRAPPASTPAPVAPTPTTPIVEDTTPSSTAADIPPSPEASQGCYLHIDHWHCDGPKEGTEEEAGAEEVISDTGGEGCYQHGNHFHCPAGVTASCDINGAEDYNLGLHILALFILLIASSIGVFSPVLLGSRATSSKGLLGNVVFALRHFGSGVILSTAFIHLLQHAFVMFANECLGELLYESVAPAIAMASLLFVFAIDFYAARVIARNQREAADLSHSHSHSDKVPLPEDASSLDDERLRALSDKRALWEVELLEFSILLHSVMIGVTLGAMGGTGFIPTFIAILWHQMFEGFGLGARLATLNRSAMRKYLMGLGYALTTPVGIAIGIGVHSSYNPQGRAAIVTIGVLNSIAAGVLIYAAVAQLLVGDWISGSASGCAHTGPNGGVLRDMPLGKVLVGAFALFLGVLGMAVIGKWA